MGIYITGIISRCFQIKLKKYKRVSFSPKNENTNTTGLVSVSQLFDLEHEQHVSRKIDLAGSYTNV